jgi:hypothetical protein
VRVYFRETQELVFDAHDKAFQFYGGVCRRGIYDNMKTAVEAIFVGKARHYNRRFLQMCSHHLIEPVACTPASGWEKGQVENQVGNLRDQMFRPKPRVKSLTELNAWLEDQCIAYAKRTQHPEFKDRTVWDVFQEERASLMELRGPFDGFVEKAVRASTTCLIMADHNRYSVDARAAGRMVLVRSHAERIVVLLGDEIVADHPRQFRRDQIIYDPWHYLSVLVRKPGALSNGAPFKDWDLLMAGNTSDKTTLRDFIRRIEAKYGKARRTWVMERGIPTEEVLAEMPIQYLVGTPRGHLDQLEQDFLAKPWTDVRNTVQVKIVEQDDELYVLARSGARRDKEQAMRRRRPKKLIKRLHELRQQKLTRDQLLIKLGAARKDAGPAGGGPSSFRCRTTIRRPHRPRSASS